MAQKERLCSAVALEPRSEGRGGCWIYSAEEAKVFVSHREVSTEVAKERDFL